MIQKMSHTTIYVLDQDVAKEFYVDTLGFETKVDHTLPNGFRWLSVAPKGQSEVVIALMKVGSSEGWLAAKTGAVASGDAKDAEALADLLQKGMLGIMSFQTSDCRGTYEELKAKGVEFLSSPKDHFYGVEAVFRDPFGNHFSLGQPKNIQA